jgi:DNA-binding transcriptional MerR regulator
VSTYSIKDLEQLSGIKAHTLRIWEQRYNFLSPKRTETNIRYYNDDDLKLILNVSLLRDNGYKISKIAEMNPRQLSEAILKITERSNSFSDQIHALVMAMIDLDEDRFEKIMSANILQQGFENTILQLIYPFLNKIGVLWQTGSITPCQEHFISNLIRQKLIVAIDGCYVSAKELNKKYLMFLPEGELHEISLLLAHYICKSRKNRVVYLGQSVPFDDLVDTCQNYRPDYLVCIMTTFPTPDKVQRYIDRLGSAFPDTRVLVSGHQVVGQDLKLPPNVQVFMRMENFIQQVSQESRQTILQ